MWLQDCVQSRAVEQVHYKIGQIRQNHSKHFGLKPVLEQDIGALPSMLWGKKNGFVLDFGVHMVGYLSF